MCGAVKRDKLCSRQTYCPGYNADLNQFIIWIFATETVFELCLTQVNQLLWKEKQGHLGAWIKSEKLCRFHWVVWVEKLKFGWVPVMAHQSIKSSWRSWQKPFPTHAVFGRRKVQGENAGWVVISNVGKFGCCSLVNWGLASSHYHHSTSQRLQNTLCNNPKILMRYFVMTWKNCHFKEQVEVTALVKSFLQAHGSSLTSLQ